MCPEHLSYLYSTVFPFMNNPQEEAFQMTMSEIPRIRATGNESGAIEDERDAALGCTLPPGHADLEETLKRSGPVIPKRWPTEIEVRRTVRKKNPVLKRTQVLKMASGRYSIDAPVKTRDTNWRPMKLVTRQTFKDAVLQAPPSQLIVVVCLRDDDQMCERIGQMCQLANGLLYAGKLPGQFQCKPLEGDYPDPEDEKQLPARFFKFGMTSSRFLSERYGVHTIPAYLMFYGGRLVAAKSMGSRAIRLQRDLTLPRVLLVEPEFHAQLGIEKRLKRQEYQWELALNAAQAIERAKERAAIKTSRAVTYYGLIMINATDRAKVPENDAQTVVNCVRKAAAASATGVTLVCALLPMGAVRLSATNCGVLKHPTRAQLINGVADVAIMKPLKESMLEVLLHMWQAKQIKDRGAESAELQDNVSHYGFKRADLLRHMHGALEEGRKGHALPDDFQLGCQLSVNDAVFRGVRLEHESKSNKK